MIRKRIASLVCALALGSMMAISASATDYGQAGIQWMIKDEWEHRNAVGLEPYNEMETNIITCQHKDVNITGNGDYSVEFSGWCVPDDTREYVEVGTLGLNMSIDFEANPDCVVTLTDCTIDGVTYTFDEQPELEEDGDNHVLKIKNAYGVNATTTPEMDAKPWNTTDPIVINFNVSGLAEDKIENNPDEVIVLDYVEEDTEEENTDEVEEATVQTEDEDDFDQAADSADDASDENSDSSLSLAAIIAIVAGIVVVIAVIIVVAVVASKKKKK
ncbi:MAG: hypothetical protein LUI06_06630 [Ruminococcus sp.]|nr:hypothetical protein [Ruminococcus sp.]